jgi:Bacterial PH domain
MVVVNDMHTADGERTRSLLLWRRPRSGAAVKALALATQVVVLVSLTFGGPWPAHAQPYPFCTVDGAPKLGEGFRALAAQLSDRVGVAVECEHPDGTTGDVQQHTSTGLLYWRKSTNIPTFTDSAEHWALRDTQVLHWTTDNVDPPADAQVGPVPDGSAPLGAPQPAAPGLSPTASTQAAGAASSPAGNLGTGLLVAVLAIGALFLIGMSVLFFRWRPGTGSPAGARASGLVAAAAVASDPAGLARSAEDGTHMYVPTVPVQELQGIIHDIGRNRVTEQADAVLRYDPELMLWEASPSVIAVLAPRVLRWLVILVVCVFAGAWLSTTLASSATFQGGRESAAAVQWGLVVLPLALMAYSLTAAYARLRATVYRGTRQRLEIISGVFGQRTVAYELHELGDAVIERAVHYRIFGVGNLVLEHCNKPAVVLEAIAKPEGVRDMLRASGQFEAARFEKARWR